MPVWHRDRAKPGGGGGWGALINVRFSVNVCDRHMLEMYGNTEQLLVQCRT